MREPACKLYHLADSDRNWWLFLVQTRIGCLTSHTQLITTRSTWKETGTDVSPMQWEEVCQHGGWHSNAAPEWHWYCLWTKIQWTGIHTSINTHQAVLLASCPIPWPHNDMGIRPMSVAVAYRSPLPSSKKPYLLLAVCSSTRGESPRRMILSHNTTWLTTCVCV